MYSRALIAINGYLYCPPRFEFNAGGGSLLYEKYRNYKEARLVYRMKEVYLHY